MATHSRGTLCIGGKRYILKEGLNIIGRNQEAAVNIKNLNISHVHAVIIITADKHYISDFKSSNGTIVGCEKLLPFKLRVLKNEDKIELADVFAVYKLDYNENENSESDESTQSMTQNFYGADTQLLNEETRSLSNTTSNNLNGHGSSPNIEGNGEETHENSGFLRPRTPDNTSNTSTEENIHEAVTQVIPVKSKTRTQEQTFLQTQNYDQAFQEILDFHEAETQVLPNISLRSPAEDESLNESFHNDETQLVTSTSPQNLAEDKAENPSENAATDITLPNTNQNNSVDNADNLDGANLNAETQIDDKEESYSAEESVCADTSVQSPKPSTSKANNDDIIEETVYEMDNSNDSEDFLMVQKVQEMETSLQEADSHLHVSQLKRRVQNRLTSNDEDSPKSTLESQFLQKPLKDRNTTKAVIEDDDEDTENSLAPKNLNDDKTNYNYNKVNSDSETDIEDIVSQTNQDNKIAIDKVDSDCDTDIDIDINEEDEVKKSVFQVGETPAVCIGETEDLNDTDVIPATQEVLSEVFNYDIKSSAAQCVNPKVSTGSQLSEDSFRLGLTELMDDKSPILNKSKGDSRESSFKANTQQLMSDLSNCAQSTQRIFKENRGNAESEAPKSASSHELEGEKNNKEAVEGDNIYLQPTQRIEPETKKDESIYLLPTQKLCEDADVFVKPFTKKKSAGSRTSDPKAQDDVYLQATQKMHFVDQNNMSGIYNMPTQKIHDNTDIFMMPTHKLTSDNENKIHEEDIYDAATQKLEESVVKKANIFAKPAVKRKSVSPKSSSSNVQDNIYLQPTQRFDTDDQRTNSNIYDLETQKICENEDIFMMATQKLPTSSRPTQKFPTSSRKENVQNPERQSNGTDDTQTQNEVSFNDNNIIDEKNSRPTNPLAVVFEETETQENDTEDDQIELAKEGTPISENLENKDKVSYPADKKRLSDDPKVANKLSLTTSKTVDSDTSDDEIDELRKSALITARSTSSSPLTQPNDVKSTLLGDLKEKIEEAKSKSNDSENASKTKEKTKDNKCDDSENTSKIKRTVTIEKKSSNNEKDNLISTVDNKTRNASRSRRKGKLPEDQETGSSSSKRKNKSNPEIQGESDDSSSVKSIRLSSIKTKNKDEIEEKRTSTRNKRKSSRVEPNISEEDDAPKSNIRVSKRRQSSSSTNEEKVETNRNSKRKILPNVDETIDIAEPKTKSMKSTDDENENQKPARRHTTRKDINSKNEDLLPKVVLSKASDSKKETKRQVQHTRHSDAISSSSKPEDTDSRRSRRTTKSTYRKTEENDTVLEENAPEKKYKSKKLNAKKENKSAPIPEAVPQASSSGDTKPDTKRKSKYDLEDFDDFDDFEKPDEKPAVKQVIKTEVKIEKTPKKTTRTKRHAPSDENTSDSSSHSTPSKARKLASLQTSLGTPERSKRNVKPKVCFTLMEDPGLESVVRQLGGSIVDSIDACTVLITEKIKRTQKLLTSIGLGKPICTPDWIRESKKQHKFLDPYDFLLRDAEAEAKWKFTLAESLQRSSENKLLEGYTFHLIVNNAADVLKGAIETCGGKCLNRLPGKDSLNKFYVVSTPDCKSKYSKIKKQHSAIPVIAAEAIFDGVLRQELQFEKHVLQ